MRRKEELLGALVERRICSIVMWVQEIELTWRNFTSLFLDKSDTCTGNSDWLKKKKIEAFFFVNFTPLKKWEIPTSFHSSWTASRSTRLQILPSSLSHRISGFQVTSTKIIYVCAQSLQPCPTLCKPINWIPTGSSVLEFSSQEQWHGPPCPPPGDLSNSGMELGSSTLQADSLPLSHLGSPTKNISPFKFMSI